MRSIDARPASWVTHTGSPIDRHLEAVTSVLAPYAAVGVFGLEEHHVTAALLRIGGIALDGPGTGDLVLAIALAVRSPSRGHVCVDLRTAPERLVVDGADGDVLDALAWPDDQAWIELVAASTLVARTPLPDWAELDGDQRRIPPLILDDSRLYLERYWRYESQVIAAVAERAGLAVRPPDDGVGAHPIDQQLLADLLPLDDGGEPTRQRLAVTEALSRPATVIAGGPGTGKTYTIARLLALLVAGGSGDGASAGSRPPQIALAAPTGKAAARMTEALRQAVEGAGLDGVVAGHLNDLTATTIHRLLGHDFDNPTRFRHHAGQPLPHDVVVIDESSMVSLPLMAKLLDALSPRTRLVLVGDPDQLTSVEAGTVLGDLTHRASPLFDAVVRLDRSHRFGEHSPIGELANGLRLGDPDAVRATMEASDEAITWLPVTASAWDNIPAEIERLALDAAEGVYDAGREGDAQAAVHALGAIRLLCAHRRGGSGVEAWNERVAELLARTRPGSADQRGFAIGTPWLVTANDQANRLANGDAVVIIDSDGHPSGILAGPELRTVPLSHLDAVEPFQALTIHKSQGSEFDHAVVILPPPGSPILTRELLYTAVTRAKSRLTIVGEAEAIEQAVRRKTDRASGLIERWEADQPGR
ncbi:MAG: exodeoxyribonuclease V subunit alpha [Candidatus Microthrix sp.]|nr:exodeoxyribonuclease V subunit alpha [Candidatus Microthrix sp.]MBK7322445.1 exodeoxyribonuclease V subunit alpha [Candidatus Microthrix sp.]